MHSLLVNCFFWVSFIMLAYIKPKPPNAESAIMGSTDKSTARIEINMMLELMRVKNGTMVLPMTPLALFEIPLITSLLLRATCTA